MEESNIRKYATLMRELGLTGLEINENGCAVRLERNEAPQKPVISIPDEPASSPAPRDDAFAVKSPMVGVFYAAPTESAPPYVKVGDRVKCGDTLCIIESMKLMNEITSDTDGEIAEICARNGEVVDFGKPLFRIRKERP